MVMHIAFVAQTPRIPADELAEVAAAIQKQVTRDVAPLWNLQATVDCFPSLDSVPLDYWRIVVEDFGAAGVGAGVHLAPHDGQPYARVPYSDAWSLVASHETIEMLVDPSLNNLRAGNAIDGSGHRVRYLMEVCDPCQAPQHGYRVNGCLVSDFVAPWYYDPVSVSGLAYSFCGRLTRPHDIAEGGYLTWFDQDLNSWRQAERRGGRLNVSGLVLPPSAFAALREQINTVTGSPRWWTRGLAGAVTKARLSTLKRARRAAQKAHAEAARTWSDSVYGPHTARTTRSKRTSPAVRRGR